MEHSSPSERRTRETLGIEDAQGLRPPAGVELLVNQVRAGDWKLQANCSDLPDWPYAPQYVEIDG